jgi:hypothetical protein
MSGARSFDVLGALSITGALVLTVYAIVTGPEVGRLTSRCWASRLLSSA